MNSRLSRLSQPLSAEQRRITEEMNAGPGAGSACGGPFDVWLRTALGEPARVELTGLLGYYTLVAFTLNAFEVEVPQAGFELLTKPV
jgi:hypothetical protein